MKKLIAQMIKFGMVGGLCFLIDYGIMVFLKEIGGFNYLWASGLSFCISVIVNYILSMRFVFDANEERNKIAQFVIFIVLSVIGLGINQLVMWVTVDGMNIFYMLAKIIATAIVMVYNFITRKLIIEK